MNGIPADKFGKMPPEHLNAMRKNHAETMGVPIERVKWRNKCRGPRSMFFLYVTPAKRTKKATA